jgi:hypothetical protein
MQELMFNRALPILRQLGAQSGSSMIRGGDFSMLKVWVGLEARSFLQASIETVSTFMLHVYVEANSTRLNDASSMISSRRTYERAHILISQ